MNGSMKKHLQDFEENHDCTTSYNLPILFFFIWANSKFVLLLFEKPE